MRDITVLAVVGLASSVSFGGIYSTVNFQVDPDDYDANMDGFITGSELTLTGNDPGGTEFEFTSTSCVEFADEGGGTRVTLTQHGLPPMPNACDIVSTGTNDSLDKLDRFLAG